MIIAKREQEVIGCLSFAWSPASPNHLKGPKCRNGGGIIVSQPSERHILFMYAIGYCESSSAGALPLMKLVTVSPTDEIAPLY